MMNIIFFFFKKKKTLFNALVLILNLYFLWSFISTNLIKKKKNMNLISFFTFYTAERTFGSSSSYSSWLGASSRLLFDIGSGAAV